MEKFLTGFVLGLGTGFIAFVGAKLNPELKSGSKKKSIINEVKEEYSNYNSNYSSNSNHSEFDSYNSYRRF